MAKRAGAWIAIYCPRKDAFLLAKRSKYVKNPFLWNFFGGQIDPGEAPKNAAIRELREGRRPVHLGQGIRADEVLLE